jgi:hypothetical protein
VRTIFSRLASAYRRLTSFDEAICQHFGVVIARQVSKKLLENRFKISGQLCRLKKANVLVPVRRRHRFERFDRKSASLGEVNVALKEVSRLIFGLKSVKLVWEHDDNR